MRTARLLSLVTLAVMLMSPLATLPDVDPPMACCGSADGATCCPVSASCSLRSCSPDSALPQAVFLPPFLLPSAPVLAAPFPWNHPLLEAGRLPATAEPELPDPPPRL